MSTKSNSTTVISSSAYLKWVWSLILVLIHTTHEAILGRVVRHSLPVWLRPSWTFPVLHSSTIRHCWLLAQVILSNLQTLIRLLTPLSPQQSMFRVRPIRPSWHSRHHSQWRETHLLALGVKKATIMQRVYFTFSMHLQPQLTWLASQVSLPGWLHV